VEIKNLESLEKLTKKELVDIAKELKLSNYSKLGKQELAELIFESTKEKKAPAKAKAKKEEVKEVVEAPKVETKKAPAKAKAKKEEVKEIIEAPKAEVKEEKKLETETTLAGKKKNTEAYVSEGYVARGNFDFSFS